MTASLLHGLPDPDMRADFYDGVPMKRAAAWGLDVVLVALICLVALPFTLFIGLFFFPVMMLVVGFLYRWATLSAGSATLGMRVMGIEIREGDGGRLRPTTAFLHTLGYSVSVAMFPLQLISAAMMLGTPRRQGLSDLALATAAINRPFGA